MKTHVIQAQSKIGVVRREPLSRVGHFKANVGHARMGPLDQPLRDVDSHHIEAALCQDPRMAAISAPHVNDPTRRVDT